jgi:hypothetical protein
VRVAENNNQGQLAYKYTWTGDYKVPVLRHDKLDDAEHKQKTSQSTQEDSSEVCYRIQSVRKAFTLQVENYQEDEMQAFVLPRRPKKAMLVHQAGKHLKLLACVLFFVPIHGVLFSFPGLVVPFQILTATDSGDEYYDFMCPARNVIWSYCLGVSSTIIICCICT